MNKKAQLTDFLGDNLIWIIFFILILIGGAYVLIKLLWGN